MPGREGFTRDDRIRQSAEYKALRDAARRVHTRHFVILVMPREGQIGTRLGITVTKRIAKAVGRNRIKRVVREVFRRERHLFPAGCDVVLIARVGSADVDYAQLRTALLQVQPHLRRAANPGSPRAAGGGL